MYAKCSLKYLYKISGKESIVSDADERYIMSVALKDTYIKYFHQKGLGKPMNNSNAMSMFSSKLIAYKTKWLKDKSLAIQDTKTLLTAHQNIVDAEKFINPEDELIAASFPVERVIGDRMIKDEIDLIVFRHPKNKESYIEIIYFDVNPLQSKPDFTVMLRANLGLTVVKQDLMGEALIVKCTVYNILSGKSTDIELSHEHRFNYRRFIKSLFTGIESKLFYPRDSYNVCEHCSYSSICSWKVNEKDKIIASD